jgi:hypothetical protein
VPINRMRILQEANRVKTETSPFHLGSTSVFLLGHRSDKSFSPETNRPEPGRRADWPQRSARGANIGIGFCHRGHGARTPRRQETDGGTRRRDGVLVIRDWWLGFDEGRLAAKRRKRRKNRTAEDGGRIVSQGHGARTQRRQETGGCGARSARPTSGSGAEAARGAHGPPQAQARKPRAERTAHLKLGRGSRARSARPTSSSGAEAARGAHGPPQAQARKPRAERTAHLRLRRGSRARSARPTSGSGAEAARGAHGPPQAQARKPRAERTAHLTRLAGARRSWASPTSFLRGRRATAVRRPR